MASLQDLLRQQEALAAEIDRVRLEEKTRAIAQVRELMFVHGLTLRDLGKAFLVSQQTHKGKSVRIKYRDPQTGDTWTGRGLRPNWLKRREAEGQSPEQFAV